LDYIQPIPTHLKIDVEGFEVEVLRGARKTLTRSRPILFLELHLNYLEHRSMAPKESIALLQEAGYRFRLLDGTPIGERELCDCPLDRIHFVAVPA